MWSLLPRSTQLLIIVGTTVVLVLGLQGIDQLITGKETSLLKYVSAAASIIGLIGVATANWIWRPLWRWFPKLGHWFFPDLNGTWQGALRSTWENPAIGESPGPIQTTITIRQTLFTTSVRQRTNESSSWSTRVISECDRDADRYRLWYSYDNKPSATVSPRSGQHEGVAWLEVSMDENPNRLLGQYYTSRKTSGDIDVQRVSDIIPTKQ